MNPTKDKSCEAFETWPQRYRSIKQLVFIIDGPEYFFRSKRMNLGIFNYSKMMPSEITGERHVDP